VLNPRVIKSLHPDFVQLAIEAVKLWKFEAVQGDGVPIKAKVAIPLRFSMAGE
jgi:outer membrane biosynthesis protein TonB